jgi:hypothetical protein
MDIGQQSIIRIGGMSGSQNKDCSEAKVKEAKVKEAKIKMPKIV